MDRFSEAYKKAQDVVKGQKFAEDWQKFLDEKMKVKSLLLESGPSHAQANGLDSFRDKLSVGGGGKATAAAKILEASETKASKMEERAATLKMLKHLYLRKKGGQNVWVWAGPKAYAKWVYDEFAGKDKAALKSSLASEEEVYSEDNRKMMCDAVQLCLKWSLDACAKLASPKDETKKIVKRWFADQNTTDETLKNAMSTLKDGFQRIANVANSNELVFSDEPLDRNAGGWKDWAYVYSEEKIEVVYLQNAFLKAGNSGKLWKCVLTIIHELSHRCVSTDDHAYDSPDGLKPDKDSFPHDKAIDNADSWAYFATDLAGCLSNSDRSSVLK